MGTWRRAYGALKDSTRVGLCKLSSEFKELDIAIVKATNHEECSPKERHVRKIILATTAVRPRADIAYCIYALAKRLSKTHNWVVAVKTLIVIHRMLREGDPTFKEELLNYSHKGHILQISNFKDDSSPLAWDCSAWVRTYALFLEERLECLRVLNYDIEAERLIRNTLGDPKGHSRSRTLSCPDLLVQMPALQQLLHRLVGCQPEGAAFGNKLIQYALALVLKESFKIYCAVNDGIINLVDMFFEMTKFDAIKALEVYKRAGQQAENLSDFYDFCKKLELARNFQFPTLRQPPPSFLATMEEYIREAPCMNNISSNNLDYQEKNLLTYKEEENAEATQNSDPAAEEVEEERNESMEAQEPLESIIEVEPLVGTTGDLLGVDEIRSIAAEIEQKNALALAIVQPGDGSKETRPMDLLGGDSGWELALISTPSNNISNVVERKLAGGFDKLLLDSLYEDASRMQQVTGGTYIGAYHPNSFSIKDPFIMSNDTIPPTNAQMTLFAQQQQHYYYQQQQQLYYHHPQQQQYQYQQQQMSQYNQQQQHMMEMVPYGYQQQQTNPFSVPFTGYSQSAPSQANSSLI